MSRLAARAAVVAFAASILSIGATHTASAATVITPPDIGIGVVHDGSNAGVSFPPERGHPT